MCAYNLSAIDQIFESGQIKQPRNTRENSHLSWELYSGSIPANLGTCASSDETPSTTAASIGQNSETNYLPIAHKWIEPMTGSILAHSNTHNFQSLDSVTSANYTFVHVVTNSLKVLKLTVDRVTLKTHVTHSIQLPKVTSNEFSDGLFNDNFTYFAKTHSNNVFVGSTWSVYKAPTSLCPTFTSCSDCLLSSNDFECRWSSSNRKCFSIFESTEISVENSDDVMSKDHLMTSRNKSCPGEDTLNKTYHITFLPPLPSEQATSPVFSASEITLFCGANFRIESLSKSVKSLENTEMNLPNARWYENSRDISQGVGKCGSVGINVLSCNDSISILGSPVETQISEGILKTISGFTYSILRVSAHHTANYTCIFHYGPKSFISNSVLLRVKSRKEHVDNVYTSYIEQLKQYYVQTCNMETYCATDGCKVDNKNRFQSCLRDQTKNPS